MITKILDALAPGSVERGAELIKNGEIVAFPTETVYGLGANGLDAAAVSKIFKAKGRPSDNPLILHIADKGDAEKLWTGVPDVAKKLMDRFFPGPLTIIYKKSSIVPDIVSASLDTVAIRMPENETARKLISLAGVPIAAPSANTSGKPSPTNAKHVYDDMQGKIELILDGGECRVGVESTVIKINDDDSVTVLRPGAITKEMLEEEIKNVSVAKAVLNPLKDGEKAESPGMLHKHYSPDCEVIVALGDIERQAEAINKEYEKTIKENKKCIILATKQTEHFYMAKNYDIIGDRNEPMTLLHSLFAKLRQYSTSVDLILCEAVDETGEGLAYMNRLLRAAGFKTI